MVSVRGGPTVEEDCAVASRSSRFFLEAGFIAPKKQSVTKIGCIIPVEERCDSAEYYKEAADLVAGKFVSTK
jgi:hypothetical protein